MNRGGQSSGLISCTSLLMTLLIFIAPGRKRPPTGRRLQVIKSDYRCTPVTRTLMMCLTVLPLAPRRGWESGFTGCHLVGPYHDLLAILPLDGDRLMTDVLPENHIRT